MGQQERDALYDQAVEIVTHIAPTRPITEDRLTKALGITKARAHQILRQIEAAGIIMMPLPNDDFWLRYYPKTNQPTEMLQVPATPEPERIESMCLRFDHSHGIRRWVTDEDGEGEETDEEFERRKEANRTIMRQLYEEATGQGFYKGE